MKMLALEFSTEWRSAAVAIDGVVAGVLRESSPRQRGALELMEGALAASGCDRSAVEAILVGRGPGSYTGVRVAVALAQGWNLGRTVRLIGLESTWSIAWQAWLEGVRGTLSVVVDAQRREYYLERFRLEEPGPGLQEACRLVDGELLSRLAADGGTWAGPEAVAALPALRRWVPEASSLLSALTGPGRAAVSDQLEPVYLRATNFVKAPPPREVPPLRSLEAREHIKS